MAVVREEQLPNGWQGVRLENQELSVLLLPEKGSDIYELRARHHNLDLLWKTPWGLHPPGFTPGATQAATAWLDRYAGGWQELFPNAGDACSYQGAELGFHGEASVSPWHSTLSKDQDGSPEVRLELRCCRMPFRLEKRIALAGDRPVLRLWERITNEGAEPLPFMWGHHPAYGAPFLAAGCQFELPAKTFIADDEQTSPRTWLTPGQRSSWPMMTRNGRTIDLSRVPGPEAGVANFGYALELEEGWYALTNPHLGLGIGMVWPLAIFPCVWIWQEFQGTMTYPWYGRAYVLGVEPHTSYPGHGLQRALAQGTARWLAPGEQLELELRAVVFAAQGLVHRIAPDGQVAFAR
jgi:hypothetical protein